jgi:hypothetical protein
MTVFAKHFTSLLRQPLMQSSLSISCRNVAPIQLSEAVRCLRAVNYNGQALSMACERYMCRVTPAAGATCLPAARLLQAMYHCWELLFGQGPATEQLQRLGAQQAAGDQQPPVSNSTTGQQQQEYGEITPLLQEAAAWQQAPAGHGKYLQADLRKEQPV